MRRVGFIGVNNCHRKTIFRLLIYHEYFNTERDYYVSKKVPVFTFQYEVDFFSEPSHTNKGIHQS